MKQTAMRTLKSCVSLLLVLCMVLSIMPMTALATESESTEKPIVYVSIGDSMTNGYCLDGYDGTSGAVNYGLETYSNKFAAWLAGYTGPITNDQVIFKGNYATVDHRQLSISGLRAQDIHWILEMDYTDNTLMQNVFNMDYNDTGWNADYWYNTLGLYGDRYTWSEYGDYDYRYADAAARILAMYHGGNGTGYFTSSYTDEATIQKAIAGIKANPYYPEGKGQASEMGGYKYLQVATEFYQKSMEDADIISLAVGNTNFGTHMLSNITDVIMGNDMSFSREYSIDQAKALAAEDPFAKAQVEAMLASEDFAKIVDECKYLAGDNQAWADEIGYIVEYATISFITGYIGMLNSILELNPDAEIIMVALMNAYENKDGTTTPKTLGSLVETIYTPMNNFLETLPAKLMASKSAEDQEKYADAAFYFAEAPYVSCMVDVFGDDYYAKDGSFVEYPGLLAGTEGYTANENSIVRDRFVEEIVCGNMIFNAMGLKKQKTQENMDAFLWGGKVYNTNGSLAYDGVGVVAYDMMTLAQKATYAAQNAGAAKEYALYLAFENSLIRSGTENVTMDALAGLANIQSAFLAFYPTVESAIGAASVNYYSNVYDGLAPLVEAPLEASIKEAGYEVDATVTGEEIKAIVEAKDETARLDAAKVIAENAVLQIYVPTVIEKAVNGIDTVFAEVVKSIKDMLGADVSLTSVGYYNYLFNAELTELDETAKKQLLAAWAEDAYNDELEYTAEFPNLIAYFDSVLPYPIGAMVLSKILEMEVGAQGMAMISAYALQLQSDEATRAGMWEIEDLAAILNMIAATISGNQALSSENVGLLAYLLALPQAMSDTLYNDSNMQGALCMNARCLLGTGAGGHPSVGGHEALFDAVLDAYVHITYKWSDDGSTCTAALNNRFTADATVTGEVTTPATCKVMGTTTYTANFDATWAKTQTKSIQDVPTTDHGYESVVTKPTCTEDGYTTYTCKVCGHSYVADEVAKNGHSYDKVVTTPTCTDGGYTTYTCAACGHSYVADEVAKNGHDYKKVVTAPTCTAEGYTTYTCATCGDSYVDNKVDATGHTKVTDKAVAATCTKTGLTEGSHCSVCNTVIVAQKSVPATGHAWNNGIVVKEPTVEETGIKRYTCATCGETRDETVPVLQPTEAPISRISGDDRYKTALAAADELKKALGVKSFESIILASGENFADALTGSYLAAVKKAPILLHSNSAMEDNILYIASNLAEGGTIYILGGNNAVPDAIDQMLNFVGINFVRLAGEDRFETNLKILEEAGVGEKDILVCTAYNFADSLSASAVGLPILLVNNNSQALTKAQSEFLDKLDGNDITIIGGINSVSEKLKGTLADYGTVSRVAGDSREETSVLVAKAFFNAPESVILAYSRNYPDGLCGGPLAYALKAPLLLTSSGTEKVTAEYVQEQNLEKAIILGGVNSVSDATVNLVFTTK